MRIALIGHACGPNMGSEPGITWNWATQLARHHDVTLLTYPIYRDAVEAELARHPHPGLHWEWLETGRLIDRYDPARGERGIRFHYRLWQRTVLNRIRELHARQPFDLVHHVSWGTLQQPPLLWKLGLPFVWGPIGGGQTWPANFLSYATRGRMGERIRRAVVRLTRWNPAVVRAVRGASLVLATNSETADVLNQLGAKRVECFADSGVQPDWLDTPHRNGSQPGRLNMLWAGRCEPRKGVPLVLEAMAQATDPAIEFVAAGEGPCQAEWEQKARDLGLGDRVRFLGRVPWTRMSELFQEADAFIFPSLRDSFGTVILEAMSRKLPLITLDHQGVGRILPASAGLKVRVTDPDTTVRGLADAMRTMAANPNARHRMGEAAAACAAEQAWDKRAEAMNRWYEEVLRAHRRI